MATQGFSSRDDVPAPLMDLHVDTRQVVPDQLRHTLCRALRITNPEYAASTRIPLEDFQSMRHSIVWEFNKFYWRHLNAWGKGFGTRLRQSVARRRFRRT
ncbi:MAG: hypothetical protein WDO18_00015 [Acidobacteriota bacterium]